MPERFARVTVVARDAATADGLSTAFSLMTENEIRGHVRANAHVTVDLAAHDGGSARFGHTL
ncbi:MAG: hypothetical protein ACK4QP_03065 [Pseudorhizobium sp.]